LFVQRRIPLKMQSREHPSLWTIKSPNSVILFSKKDWLMRTLFHSNSNKKFSDWLLFPFFWSDQRLVNQIKEKMEKEDRKINVLWGARWATTEEDIEYPS
jgi:hypothetical protein